MTYTPLITCVIQLAGTTCTIYREGAQTLLPGSTEYVRAQAPVYTDIPCRAVDASAPRQSWQIDYHHEMVDVDMVFYLPAEWMGAPVSLQEADDWISYQGTEYEVIRTEVPSGGSLIGAQQTYAKVYTRRMQSR